MKHLAKIQSELLKAAKWTDLSPEAQKEYLKKHRKSKKRLTAKPKHAGPVSFDWKDEDRANNWVEKQLISGLKVFEADMGEDSWNLIALPNNYTVEDVKKYLEENDSGL